MTSHENHNKSRSAEYRIWGGIKTRCFNQHDRSYAKYGARGISMSPEWRDSFREFFAYVGPRPTPRHSIDRINNTLGYIPGNVRWALPEVQQNNKSNTRRIVLGDQASPLQDIARASGIASETIARRIERGMNPTVAAMKPIDPTKTAKFLEFNGITKSVKDWAQERGVSANLICKRLRKGWLIEDALRPSTRRPRP